MIREEAEVKKNIEWLKQEINDNGISALDLDDNELVIELDMINEFLDQLDEPETLSEYWIEQKSIDTHVDTLNGEIQVTFRLDDLQNLLVPEQEEVDQAYKDGYEKGKEHTFYKGYLEGLAEGERKTNEYFESIAEEPSYEQVQKYLSEHGMEVVEKPTYSYAVLMENEFYLEDVRFGENGIVKTLRATYSRDKAIKFNKRELAQSMIDLIGEGVVEELEE